MTGNHVLSTEVEPTTGALAYEGRFTVESIHHEGGDFLKNIGGNVDERRVTFEGYASPELYDALVDAIGKVVG